MHPRGEEQGFDRSKINAMIILTPARTPAPKWGQSSVNHFFRYEGVH